MKFSIILAKEKRIMEVLRIKFWKYGRNFRFTICLFQLTLFFVRIKQTSKSRSSEAAIQMCSQGKNKKVAKIHEKQLWKSRL